MLGPPVRQLMQRRALAARLLLEFAAVERHETDIKRENPDPHNSILCMLRLVVLELARWQRLDRIALAA